MKTIQKLIKIMASDLLVLQCKIQVHSEELFKGIDGIITPSLEDSPTTGKMPKFEKVVSNIEDNIGILEFKIEGD